MNDDFLQDLVVGRIDGDKDFAARTHIVAIADAIINIHELVGSKALSEANADPTPYVTIDKLILILRALNSIAAKGLVLQAVNEAVLPELTDDDINGLLG